MSAGGEATAGRPFGTSLAMPMRLKTPFIIFCMVINLNKNLIRLLKLYVAPGIEIDFGFFCK